MVSKNNRTGVRALTQAAVSVFVAMAAQSGCGGGSSGSASAPTVQPLSAAATAGEALFNDKSLSASGKQSCATCHVKSRAFTGDPAVDNGLPVPLGGRNMDLPGFRHAPSLMYAAFTPAFSIDDGTASGGFFRDGRASSLAAQAMQPLVTQFEMANQDGNFSDLHKVVEWYVTRDFNNNTGNNPTSVQAGPGSNPYQAVGTFYIAADGTPDLYQYNDLPTALDANVNVGEVPYTAPESAGGNAPTLNAQEIDDLVAFLCTLTDGYDPSNPSAYNVPTQCQPIASP